MSLFRKAVATYVGSALLTGVVNGDRYWNRTACHRLYDEGEERLATREAMDYASTLFFCSAMNLAPPILLFSTYRNIQRAEIWWLQMDPEKFPFYYDRF